MKIIVATKNKGKIREIEKIFGDLGVEVISQHDAGIDIEVEENGTTFVENALIKARAVAGKCDSPVMADDSGLCVDALDGRPGVYSARYAGENATDEDRVNKLLCELSDKTNRGAEFVSAIAFVFPDGSEYTTIGKVRGSIMTKPQGNNGFGYDPVFFCDELGKGFAIATADEKNSVSHRGRALNAMYEKIKPILAAQEEK